jgi:DNA-binding MarR family transcriptional regulator
MEHLREKNDTAVLLALRMGLKRKQVTPHIKVLHDFGLIKRLPRSASPFDPSKKSVYQLYGITTKGLQLLQMYEKKPEV